MAPPTITRTSHRLGWERTPESRCGLSDWALREQRPERRRALASDLDMFGVPDGASRCAPALDRVFMRWADAGHFPHDQWSAGQRGHSAGARAQCGHRIVRYLTLCASVCLRSCRTLPRSSVHFFAEARLKC